MCSLLVHDLAWNWHVSKITDYYIFLFKIFCAGNDLRGIASQFATPNLGFAVQFCNCAASTCVKYMIHARASIQLLR